MAELIFPSSPSLGQMFPDPPLPNVAQWRWDGAKWVLIRESGAYLPLAGGTMSGPLILAGAPTDPLEAVTKQYADQITGRNRIINGGFQINTWRGQTTYTPVNNDFVCDRFKVFIQSAGRISTRMMRSTESDFPANFPALGGLVILSNSAFMATNEIMILYQPIEYFNMGDLYWGTPQAQPVMLQFMAMASQAGTYSGSVMNGDSTHAFPFSFVLSANTATQVAIPIPGATAGVWKPASNNASDTGMTVRFDLGSGAGNLGPANVWASANYVGVSGSARLVSISGATLWLTNLSLKKGVVATPYEEDDISVNYSQCRRYFQTYAGFRLAGYGPAGNMGLSSILIPVGMRAAPTVQLYGATYTNSSGLSWPSTAAIDVSPSINITTTGAWSVAGTLNFNAEL